MTNYRASTITQAPANTPCGWTHGQSTCQGSKPAVHVLLKGLPVAPAGTALCAYHSPFDDLNDPQVIAYNNRHGSTS